MIESKIGLDVRGQPTFDKPTPARCAVVKLIIENAKSSVRADSSASRGNAQELEATSVFLLPASVDINIDDLIVIYKYRLQIVSIQPRFDVNGRFDHQQVNANMWSPE